MSEVMISKDEEFCRLIVFEGFSPKAAYACVWEPSNEASAMSGASRKMKEVWVQDKLAELRGMLDDRRCLSLREKRAFLARVVRGECGVNLGLFDVAPTFNEVLAAIKVDNDMAGHNAAAQVDVGAGRGLVEAIWGVLGEQGLRVGGDDGANDDDV